jgi:hypothetical protein
MMWRTGGLGELYLYAPRAKQTTSLCTTPPLTYCGTADGMSIGRGAFTFKRGGWTHIRQDIWLNTPGVPDGGFNIWYVYYSLALRTKLIHERRVDGKLVISNDETYFRNTKTQTTSGGKVKAIPRQLLFDSLPNTGFNGALPSLDGEDSPFAAASTCDASMPTQSVYENRAVKLVQPTVSGYKVVTKTQTATRHATSTKLHIATSTATIHKPSTETQVVYTTQTLYADGSFPSAEDDRIFTGLRMVRRAAAKTTTSTQQAFKTETEVLETTQTARTTVTQDEPVTLTLTSTVIKVVKPTSSAVASATGSNPSSGPLGSDAIRNPDRPWTFAGIQHMTFFGGSADKWRAKKTEYAYFNNWSFSINA